MTKNNFNLSDLGFKQSHRKFIDDYNLDYFTIGRIILEHKDRYVTLTELGEIDCEVIGNLRFTAQSRADLPVVGDWVALQEYDIGKGLIHSVFPRDNVLERQAVGRNGEKQLIASNIDYGLILQSINRDFSMNRLERYIAICHAASINPIIVLTKVDLVEREYLSNLLDEVKNRLTGIMVVTISNLTGEGLDQIKALVKKSSTYCLLGSSGVGKSTLINSLSGNTVMKTGTISESIDRGKHVTTHRELVILEKGGIIIDNPGMREVGITDSTAGLEMTFELIYELAEQCKFHDCSHQVEKGCAILSALESGELQEETYKHFLKLEREQAHFSATIYEKRKKDKAFGKMVKQIVKQKSQNKR